MRTSLLLTGLAAAAVLAASTLVLGQPQPAPPLPLPAAAPGAPTTQVQLEHGRYLVELGDCVACHTQKNSARFAGGRPLETPFGTILSANITPDRDTGIGGWTPEQFYRALHEGVNAQGQHLYPAFPYNYYTRLTREDTDAIFAYLQSLPPVRHGFKRNRLPFPFNIRGLMVFWNWLFLEQGPYKPDASKPAEWNRGAYLVEGLGHCQACHTAKNIMGAPKKGEAFRGGPFGEWFAPDITPNQRTGIGGWDDDALREFLHRGTNVHSAASAEMGEVVAFSTSQMNDADLKALALYLRNLPTSPAPALTAPEAAVMMQGEAIWQDSCAACHRMDGSGSPRYFPPLKGNPNLQQHDASTVVHFILAGTRRLPTDAAPTPFSMPSFAWKLNDQQVAAVATFARNSWGNAAEAVSAEQVAKLRGKLRFEAQPEAGAPDMAHPGPGTLAPAETDSRDNGTAQAGRAASGAK